MADSLITAELCRYVYVVIYNNILAQTDILRQPDSGNGYRLNLTNVTFTLQLFYPELGQMTKLTEMSCSITYKVDTVMRFQTRTLLNL